MTYMPAVTFQFNSLGMESKRFVLVSSSSKYIHTYIYVCIARRILKKGSVEIHRKISGDLKYI